MIYDSTFRCSLFLLLVRALILLLALAYWTHYVLRITRAGSVLPDLSEGIQYTKFLFECTLLYEWLRNQ